MRTEHHVFVHDIATSTTKRHRLGGRAVIVLVGIAAGAAIAAAPVATADNCDAYQNCITKPAYGPVTAAPPGFAFGSTTRTPNDGANPYLGFGTDPTVPVGVSSQRT